MKKTAERMQGHWIPGKTKALPGSCGSLANREGKPPRWLAVGGRKALKRFGNDYECERVIKSPCKSGESRGGTSTALNPGPGGGPARVGGRQTCGRGTPKKEARQGASRRDSTWASAGRAATKRLPAAWGSLHGGVGGLEVRVGDGSPEPWAPWRVWTERVQLSAGGWHGGGAPQPEAPGEPPHPQAT